MYDDHDLYTRLMEPHRELLRQASRARDLRLADGMRPGLYQRVVWVIGSGLIAAGTRLCLAGKLPEEPVQ